MAVKVRERRPGEWWIFVDHHGERTAKKVGDKDSAIAIAKEIERKRVLADLKVESPHRPANVTLAEYAERYLENVKGEIKHSTWVDYEANFRLHIKPLLGDRPLAEISRRDVKGLARRLRQNGHAPKGVRKIVGTLSAMLSEAVDDELIECNPALNLKKLYRSIEFTDHDKGRCVNALTQAELTRLLCTARDHAGGHDDAPTHPFRRHYPFLLLLARSGLRLGEACALQWGDIDFGAGTIEVRRAFVKGRITTPKNRKPRRVYMSQQLHTVLSELHQQRLASGEGRSNGNGRQHPESLPSTDAWIFGPGDRPLDPDNFRRRVFGPLLEAAQLRHIRIHDLRHTYASLMIAARKELHFIQQQLGHHSPEFTLSIYGHLLPRDRRDEVNCLDDEAISRNPGATRDREDDPSQK